MKLNSKRKNVIIGCLVLFLISVVYLPTEMKHDEIQTVFLGYEFIWDIYFDIALRTLLIEWVAIAVIFSALFAINGSED
jgi:hypothetical protein